MNFKLTIEGSASQLAMILASLPDGVAVAAPSIPAPVAAPVAAMPVPPMPANGGGDDDDDGPANTAAPAVDASGLPWDERIHAKTKSLNADGTWKKRRNGPTGPELTAIEAQLRASVGATVVPPVAQAIPAPVAMPAAPMQPLAAPAPLPVAAPAPVVPAVMEQPVVAAAPAYSPPPMPAPVAAVPPMPAPEPAPQPAPAPAAPAPTGTVDFAVFMQHLSEQMGKRDAAGAPLVHADYLAAITNEISTAFAPQGVAPLTAITDIAANPAMITYAMQLMLRDGRW